MPELPDITIYVERLATLLRGRQLNAVRIASPFLLRTADPPIAVLAGRTLTGVERLGKRIVLAFDGELFLVLHLMIAGRLKWRKPGAPLARGAALAALDFIHGTLILTEAGSKRRAAAHLIAGRAALLALHAGGIEPLAAGFEAFAAALRRENHTVKRALTDPRVVSGIGNAYSDEILHRARLSPFRTTHQISDHDMQRLYAAMRSILAEWTARLRDAAGDTLPEKVTAFREGMAVHGRYRQPCPDCGAPVQRVRYAENECNYCAACQSGGRIYADRALSRLLHDDWPRTLDELETVLPERTPSKQAPPRHGRSVNPARRSGGPRG